MEKAVFQVMVSLNIRKDSIAETLPLPMGTQREAQTSSSNCLVDIQVLFAAGSRIEEFQNVILRYVTS